MLMIKLCDSLPSHDLDSLMISVLALSVVDHGFEPLSGQTRL